MAWWATRSTMASNIGAGSRRPRPATHHTGVELSPAAAASTAEPVAASERGARRAPRPRRGRGRRRRWRSPPTSVGTSSHSMSLRSSRCTNDDAWCPASTASTRTSPRRARARPIELGPADRGDGRAVGELGDQPVDRWRHARSRRSPPRPAAIGSELVSMRAHSHHSGPHVGWRSTMRRQATTSPAGSSPRPRSAPAVSRTSDSASAPLRPGHVAEPLDRVHPLTVPTVRPNAGTAVLGRASALLATVAPRGDGPTAGPRAGPARRRGAAARGVADDVPPRHRGARPVHQRELVDPADGDAHPRRPARLRRPGQLPRHRRRADARAFLGPLAEEFLVFLDPDRVAVKALGLDPAAGVRVRPRRRHRAGGGRGLERAGVARPSPRPIADGDGVARAGHPAGRRPRAVPRVAGARLTVDPRRTSPTSRSSRSSTICAAALAGPGPGRRRRPARRRQDDGRPAGAARRAVARRRRIVVLEPRRLATRAAARRMADAHRHEVGGLVGYQTRDERRIGRDTRIEVVTEGVLTRRLQHDPELPGVGLVVFDEVHERNLTTDLGLAFTLDAAAHAASRPAHPGDVGDRRHRALFARLLADDGRSGADRRERRADAPGRRALARRAAATSASRPAVADAVRRALREETGDVLVFLPGIGEIRRVADAARRHRRPGRRRPPLAGALSLEEQDRALAPSPPGRRRVVLATDIAETSLTVEGVRVVVDSGLARAPRFDAGTGHDPADDRVDQPRLGRPARRAGRAHRAGRGLPAVEPHGARHPAGPSGRRDHPGRPGRAGARAGGVGHAGRASWRSSTRRRAKARRQADELLAELGALDADGAITALGRRDGRPAGPPAAGPDDRRPARRAGVRRRRLVDERDVLRGAPRRAARPTSRCASQLVCRRRRRRPRRPARRAAGCASGPPTSPGGPACRFDLDARRPRRRRRGAARRLPRPARRPPPARAVPAAHRRRRVGRRRRPAGDGAVRRRRRPRRQAVGRPHPPRRGASTRPTIAGAARRRRRGPPRWSGTPSATTSSSASSAGSTRCGSARSARRPAPGEDTTAALVDRVRGDAGSAVAAAGRRRTTQLRARVGVPAPRRSASRGRTWSDRAPAAPRSTSGWRRTSSGATGRADLDRLDLAMLLRADAAVAAGRRARRARAAARGRCPTGRDGADRLRRRAADGVGAGAGRVRRHATTRRSPAGGCRSRSPCCPPPTARSRSPPTCPASGPARGPTVRKDMAGRYPKHHWPGRPGARRPGRLRDADRYRRTPRCEWAVTRC